MAQLLKIIKGTAKPIKSYVHTVKSDQLAHLSLTKCWSLCYTWSIQPTVWSDCIVAQAALCLLSFVIVWALLCPSPSIIMLKMSPIKRICVFEHSVMTNFNCACPAIQRGQGSGFLSEGSSWLTACMSEQRKFWRDCADAQARLNLRCSHRR